ncbi:MAG: hypothetical protein V4709_09110 [Pseudomonadota bacterium]
MPTATTHPHIALERRFEAGDALELAELTGNQKINELQDFLELLPDIQLAKMVVVRLEQANLAGTDFTLHF